MIGDKPPRHLEKMDEVLENAAPTSPTPTSPKLPTVPDNTPVGTLRGYGDKLAERHSTIRINTKNLDPDGDIAALNKAIRIKTKELEPLDENDNGLGSPATPDTPSQVSRTLKSQMPKSKSLSAFELNTLTSSTPSSAEELAMLADRLKFEEPPLSLEQARQRRASIKEERKKSIDFIRSRTNSRAAAMGKPVTGEKMDSYREIDEN